MQAAILKRDGDYPANEFIIASGPAAHLGRYFSGRRHLKRGEQLTLEIAGVYRHYHACLMRVVSIGKASPEQLDLQRRASDALEEVTHAIRPGAPLGEIYSVYSRALERAGHRTGNLNACGYSLGATFSPGMVLFVFLSFTTPTASAVPGETFLITKQGAERLGRSPSYLQTDH
jgi:Xaa-Pro dipeptidase